METEPSSVMLLDPPWMCKCRTLIYAVKPSYGEHGMTVHCPQCERPLYHLFRLCTCTIDIVSVRPGVVRVVNLPAQGWL